MTVVSLFAYFFSIVCVVTAIYVALSRDLLRVTIAFFLELASVGGVLLTLNADYLALIVFAIGLIGTIVVISFASVITGGLRDSFKQEHLGNDIPSGVAPRLFGMLVGLGIGLAIGWAFLAAPFVVSRPSLATAAPAEVDVMVLGKMMLGDQIIVFELLAVIVLLVVVGAGLLLRKPENAN